jgi:hypothetical protein
MDARLRAACRELSRTRVVAWRHGKGLPADRACDLWSASKLRLADFFGRARTTTKTARLAGRSKYLSTAYARARHRFYRLVLHVAGMRTVLRRAIPRILEGDSAGQARGALSWSPMHTAVTCATQHSEIGRVFEQIKISSGPRVNDVMDEELLSRSAQRACWKAQKKLLPRGLPSVVQVPISSRSGFLVCVEIPSNDSTFFRAELRSSHPYSVGASHEWLGTDVTSAQTLASWNVDDLIVAIPSKFPLGEAASRTKTRAFVPLSERGATTFTNSCWCSFHLLLPNTERHRAQDGVGHAKL